MLKVNTHGGTLLDLTGLAQTIEVTADHDWRAVNIIITNGILGGRPNLDPVNLVQIRIGRSVLLALARAIAAAPPPTPEPAGGHGEGAGVPNDREEIDLLLSDILSSEGD